MKPTIKTNCTANHYAAANERIIEFTGQNGLGGLIAVRNMADGTVVVDVYRTDAGVIVLGGAGGAAVETAVAAVALIPHCLYGKAASRSGPCSGPVDQAVVYRSAASGNVIDRSPVCRGHATEAVERAVVAGSIAQVSLEPQRSVEEMLPDLVAATGLTEDPTEFHGHTYRARRNEGELRWQVFRDGDATPFGFIEGGWCVDGDVWHLMVEDANGTTIGDPGKRSDHPCVMSYRNALHWLRWASGPFTVAEAARLLGTDAADVWERVAAGTLICESDSAPWRISFPGGGTPGEPR